MKKILTVKNKLLNHLMIDGGKKTCEKILLKSIKEIQKHSKKQTANLIQLAIIFSTPTFKLHEISNKKQKRNKKVKKIPAFIASKHTRTSLAIKYILRIAHRNRETFLYYKLKDELLLNAEFQSSVADIKNITQQEVVIAKRYFLYYRWS